jgi:hypothetical protein
MSQPEDALMGFTCKLCSSIGTTNNYSLVHYIKKRQLESTTLHCDKCFVMCPSSNSNNDAHYH